MVNPLDIYARAVRRLPLTPAERALLRTADQLLLSALAGGAVAIAQALVAGHGQLTFGALAQVGLYAAATALITGAVKLFRARGDALGSIASSALQQVEGQVQQRIPTLPKMGLNQAEPLMRRLATADTLPPLMPDSAARRRQLLAQAGIPPIAGSSAPGADVPPDAETRPSAAVAPPADPQPVPQAQQPLAQPAPPVVSVAPIAPAVDDSDDDGPPTVQVPVVRPTPTPTPTPDIAPPPPVPPSEWLVKP